MNFALTEANHKYNLSLTQELALYFWTSKRCYLQLSAAA